MASAMVAGAHHTKSVAIQSPAATPSRSPSKKAVMLTQNQKQALIDNLQLEITERARKLRAQYALQAQSLRTRIELRINRIPQAMRKANIGELYDKYLESTRQPPETAKTLESSTKQQSPAKPNTHSSSKHAEMTAALPPHGIKRNSDHISADDDKENTTDLNMPPNSKKRVKPNAIHASNPKFVLSPRSANAQNIVHQSPARPQLASPQKSYLSHPTSPLKPSITVSIHKAASPVKAVAAAATGGMTDAVTANTVEKPRATRMRGAATKATKPQTAAAVKKAKAPPITRAKRGVEPAVKDEGSRTVSAASNASNATTVVRKAGRGAATTAATRAKGKGAPKRAVPAAKVEEPAQGRRVLRKRG
ncbi:MAG: hypothetical protein LQ350_003826 [Teloschistes chrysophthalmus]|nr:MAG: hypothetical protein LQ350_003826 [Niorma chrysophthalma]